ncbi:MAG: ATP-dependent DNA helicase RecG, partial [Patescibacteria group bacterium]|nr:ATP-dependent DNA helicase RecG [Patescibacteria group bacterium]
MDISTPIEKVYGIGPVFQKKLKKIGINTISDLIFHFPHRYEDFSNLIPIEKIKINQICTIQGEVLDIKNSKTYRKKMSLTEALIKDNTAAIRAVWFNQPYLTNVLKKGDNIFLSGKIVIGNNEIYFSNPVYEKSDPSDKIIQNSGLTHTGRLVPVYPETEKLSSRWLRFILKPLLVQFKNKIPETLPEKILKENDFLGINEALWQIHFPDSKNLAERAQQRFSFEELFFIELFVLRQRAKLSKEKAVSFTPNLEKIKKFVSGLNFKLTNSQRKSAWQILKDLEKPRPMNRLLEGDVGSGKTVVAAIAALNVAKPLGNSFGTGGLQTAFMAPTEILSKQHFQEIARLFGDFSLNIGLLTGKQDQFYSKKLKNQVIEISRKKLLEKVLSGDIDILIGTHALIQDKVKFGKLGLVILDEQHRFGVEQRAKLCKSRPELDQIGIPHLLSMTATPIPRTLALTIYGDLDLSLITELPKGRKKIITTIANPEDRKKSYNFIRAQVKKGRQVFVICPRIESTNDEERARQNKKPSPWDGVKAVKEEYEKLSKEIFPELKLAMLHGKLAVKEKEKIMKDFKNKKTDILVSTSVIEVGIDVPNASVMMIEGADRFGLAQLHQFRGRVGRSKYQSYCILFTDSHSKKTFQRLRALITSEDGFSLAEKDLQIRGPGDFKGSKQWGIPDLIMNSLKDIALVEKTREIAKEILLEDSELKKYPVLRTK